MTITVEPELNVKLSESSPPIDLKDRMESAANTAAELADQCVIQLSYAIGVSKPLSIYINTMGTNKIDEAKIEKAVPELFDLSPRGIIEHLKLKNPIYVPTSAYGHFGRSPSDQGHFTWEKTDLVNSLKSLI